MRSSKTLPMLLLYAILGGGCFVQPLEPDEEIDTSVSPLTEAERIPAGVDQVVVQSHDEETSDDEEEQNTIGGALEPRIFNNKPSPEPWLAPQYVPPTDPNVSRTSSSR